MLKKIMTSFILILAFAAQSVSFAAAEEYEILYTLGIMSNRGADSGMFTRADMAKAAVRLAGLESTDKECYFIDVTDDNPYKNDIQAAYEAGIMVGKGNLIFSPSEEITFAQFKAVIMRVLSPEEYSKYPQMAAEQEKKISNALGYSLSENDKVTLKSARKMLCKLLELDSYEYAYSQGGGMKNSDDVLLNKTFGAHKYRGRLLAANGIAIMGKQASDDSAVILGADGITYVYDTNGADFSEYIGCSVDYYYSDINGEQTLLTASVRKENNIRQMMFDEVISVTNDLQTMTVKKGTGSERLNISAAADVIYNGKTCYEVTVDDIRADNGTVTLIDANDDNIYEVVRIEKFDYYIVAQINTEKQIILDSVTWKSERFTDDEEDLDVKIFKNGKELKFGYIAEGNVVAVAKSRDGKKIRAYVSDMALNGKVSYADAGERELICAGEKVSCVRNFRFEDIQLGTQTMIGLDHYGYAVGLIKNYVEPDVKLGYLVKIGSNAAEDAARLQIVTQKGELIKTDCSDKLKIDGVKCDLEDTKNAFSEYDQSSGTTEFKPQLIAYKLDDDGLVKSVYKAVISLPKENSQEPLTLNATISGDAMCVYNKFGLTMDYKYNAPNSCIVFDVPVKSGGDIDPQKIKVKKMSEKPIPASTRPSDLFIYNADNMYVTRTIVYQHREASNSTYNESHQTQAFVVNKILTRYDENDCEIKTVYKGMIRGNEAEYTFAEGLDTSKIGLGDALLIWLDDNEIQQFRRLFTFGRERYRDNTDSIVIIDKPDNEYDEAALYAIEVETSSNASKAGSRWSNAYGDACLIYKAPYYSSSVVKLKVKGTNNEFRTFTTDENTIAYIYKRDKNTIEQVPVDSLRYTYNNVLLTTRYGNVRDIIIYE